MVFSGEESWTVYLLAGVGILSCLKCLVEALRTGVDILQGGGKNLKQYGDWAVVTGATDGGGRAYAMELAKRGLNIVLISRTQSKLDAVASEIQTKYSSKGVQVKTIAADFSKTECYDHIKKELESVPVGILINNVGRSYNYAEFFHLLTGSEIQGLIDMNIQSTTRMTHMVLPGMLERKKGAIINIASAAGVIYTGNPLYTVYSATKAYVDFFSRSLNIEYKGKGIHVQSQVPYFYTSKLSKIRKPTLFSPTPETYAKSAIQRIGTSASEVPYLPHRLQHYFVQNVIPRFLLAKTLMSMHLSIRKRAYKKLQKDK